MSNSVECICVDDNDKPKQIPENKWPKRGKRYNIYYTVQCLPQRQIGVLLEEIELTDKEYPYQYFLAKRFGFTRENFDKLNALIKECTDADFSIEELMEQSQLIEVNY
jgi:hypothetical protein